MHSAAARPAPHIYACRRPREGRAENSLADIAREEQAVWPPPEHASQQHQLRHRDILRLIDDHMRERQRLSQPKSVGAYGLGALSEKNPVVGFSVRIWAGLFGRYLATTK